MAMIMKKPLKFFMVDAFTESVFKGNPAVVCFLEGKNEREEDDSWLQSLAAEFNIPLTCFVIPVTASHPPHFFLRWFTPVLEVDLCGHATLAAAHALFSDGLVGSDTIEFATRSGILTAKRVSEPCYDYEEKGSFLVELDFPVIPTCAYKAGDVSMFSKALSGASIVDVRGTTTDKIISQAYIGASKATSTDKIIDSVCGSAHCALAHYWSLKMNKCDFVAYAASRRSGTLKVHYDKKRQRVLLTGKAVTVMKGSILV